MRKYRRHRSDRHPIQVSALESRVLLSATYLPQNGWVVSDSTHSQGGDVAANAVDGNLNSRWSTDTPQAPGQYFQVNLGTPQNFNTVSIDAGPNAGDYPRGYSVYVSSNGTDWATDTAVSSGIGNSQQIVATFGVQTAQYVRIVQTGSTTYNWWSIAELNIGTTPTTPTTTVVPVPTVTPTNLEQYILELMNRARANPSAEVTRLANYPLWTDPSYNGGAVNRVPDLNEGLPAGTITTAPKQPLAFNPLLTTAARGHSQYIINNNIPITHDEPGEVGQLPRIVAAGYAVGPDGVTSENIVPGELYSLYGESGDLGAGDYSEANGFIDTDVNRGHRQNDMNGVFNEIGVGVAEGPWQSSAPYGSTAMVTEDFAYNGNGPFLTGVAFNDLNADNFYEPGEGLGGVTITATRQSDNAVWTTQTWAAGGYTLPLPAGTYTVTASGGGILSPAPQTVTISTQNVESDFIETAATPTTPAAPVIVNQPATTVTVARGNSTRLAVSFTSNPQATVQWQTSADGGNTWTNIAGATGTVYSFTPADSQNSSLFRAVITNSLGSVTSSSSTLNITALPLTVVQPINPNNQLTVNNGDVVTLTAAATGSGVTQQWSLSTDNGATYTPIAGATATSYTFTATTANNGTDYLITFTDQLGATQGSVVALWVNTPAAAAPAVVAQPTNTVTAAGNTANVTAAVQATPAATLQWQQLTTAPAATAMEPLHAESKKASPFATGPVFVDIAGGTGDTLTVATTHPGVTRYRAVITNLNGSVTTRTVTVTANKQPQVSDDLSSLHLAASAALAAINVCKRETATLVNTLEGDFRRLKITRTHGQLLTELHDDELASRIRFNNHERSVLSALLKAGAKAEVAAVRLKKSPGNAVLQAQLQSDLTALTDAAAASTAPADAQDCRFATSDSLSAIAAADSTDPKLQTDVQTGYSSAENIGQSLQAPMAIALSIANRLMTDAEGS
jgi:uncharacterized protein YkwD